MDGVIYHVSSQQKGRVWAIWGAMDCVTYMYALL
jgi:hypothetical protein